MSFPGRRKSSLAGAGGGAGAGPFDSLGAKHSASRKGGRLPVYVAGVFFVVFVIVMYGEDIRSVTLEPLARAGPVRQQAVVVSDAGRAAATPRRDVLSSSTEKTIAPRRDVLPSPERPVPVALPRDDGRESPGHATATETEVIRKVAPKVKKPKKAKKARRQRPAKKTVAAGVMGAPETCDLSRGEWVFDNASYPLYREEECSFLTSQVTCMKNGRRDDNYQKWRWQPKECDMPRFDAKLFIERLRNKRFMFVGDSLNRNQWESMVCLVQSAVSPDKKYVTWEDQRVVFHAWVSTILLLQFYPTNNGTAASLDRGRRFVPPNDGEGTLASWPTGRAHGCCCNGFFKYDVVRTCVVPTCTVAVGGGLAIAPTATTYSIRLARVSFCACC
uniref:Predicted protein n=1 Tax=Hordeum vulgare subsp. vulgare TaxID=112509 RepID=F2EFW4_HORVV|nr:predicted protein [Hordeum vulgare subsp. vulgare]